MKKIINEPKTEICNFRICKEMAQNLNSLANSGKCDKSLFLHLGTKLILANLNKLREDCGSDKKFQKEIRNSSSFFSVSYPLFNPIINIMSSEEKAYFYLKFEIKNRKRGQNG